MLFSFFTDSNDINSIFSQGIEVTGRGNITYGYINNIKDNYDK